MRRARFVVPSSIAILAAFLLACPPPDEIPVEPVVDVEAEQAALRDHAERHVAAASARDFEAARGKVTDDWTYYDFEGRRLDFDGWKEDFEAFTEVHLEISDLRSRIAGDGQLAWVTARGRLHAEAAGEHLDLAILWTAIYEKVGGEWKQRHLHASARPAEE